MGKATSERARGGGRAATATVVLGLTLVHVVHQLVSALDTSAPRLVRLRLDRVESGPEWMDAVLLPLVLLFVLSWLPRGQRLDRAAQGIGPARPLEKRVSQVCGAFALLFLAVHVAQVRWPRWIGERVHSDVYPELITSLSSTIWGGVPAAAVATIAACGAVAWYLCDVLLRTARLPLSEVSRRQKWGRRLVLLMVWAVFLCGSVTVVLRSTGFRIH